MYAMIHSKITKIHAINNGTNGICQMKLTKIVMLKYYFALNKIKILAKLVVMDIHQLKMDQDAVKMDLMPKKIRKKDLLLINIKNNQLKKKANNNKKKQKLSKNIFE